jgi:hypothetical protein
MKHRLSTCLRFAALVWLSTSCSHAFADSLSRSKYRVSTVSNNGMPKDVVKKGARWNFGPGSLWTHQGWQYAAYWDDHLS